MKNKLRPLKFSCASFPTPSISVRRRRNASRTSPGTEETSSQTSCFVNRISRPPKTRLSSLWHIGRGSSPCTPDHEPGNLVHGHWRSYTDSTTSRHKPCTRNRAPSMPSPTPEQPFEGPNNSGLLCNPQPDPQDHSQRTSPRIHRRRWSNQCRDREKSRRSLFQKDATEPLSLRQSQETDTPTRRASKSPPKTHTGRDSSTSQSRFQHHCKIRDGDTTLRSLLQRNQHHQRHRRRRSSKRAQPSNLAWAEQLQSYLELT